jgi:hypothetical protein
MILRSAITASSSATSGQTAGNVPAPCGAGVVTCTRSAPRKRIHLQPPHAAAAGWRIGENGIPPITVAADTQRRRCRKRNRRRHPGLQREECSLPTSPLQACPSRQRYEAGQRNSSSIRPTRWQWQVLPQWNPWSLRSYPNMNSRQQAPNVISLPLEKMLRTVVTVAQHFMTNEWCCVRGG